MYNAIYTEILKLKRSKILLLILIPALIIPSISINASFEIVSLCGDRWLPFLAKVQLLACFYSPIFISIYAGYIFIREYKESTIKVMLTYPVSRLKILLAKLILMIPVIALQFLLISLFGIIAGCFLDLGPLDTNILFSTLKGIAVCTILHFALLPTVILVSLLTKNNIFTAVFGLITYLLSLLFLQTNYRVYFPLCFPSLEIIHLFGQKILFEYGGILNFNSNKQSYAFIIFIVTIIISSVTCMLYFKSSEVN